MEDFINETARLLETSGFCGDRRVVMTGRGATSLMLLYETLGKKGGRVILPAIACPSLLATVLLSSMKPVIVDVDRNLNIDPDEVGKVIKPGDIVVGVHLFGIPCRINELEKICDENDSILIEDAAQAIGGVVGVEKRKVGTFGRASIFSFAKGKTVGAMGGGAILTNNGELHKRLLEIAKDLPRQTVSDEAVNGILRDELTDAFNLSRREGAKAASRWAMIYDRYPETYRRALDQSMARWIKVGMGEFCDEHSYRLGGVRIYEQCFYGIPGIRFLECPDGCVPFRFTFVVESLDGAGVQDLTEKLRKLTQSGIHVSNLYLPLHWLAPDNVETSGCPNAEFAGVRVINLWLTDNHPGNEAPVIADFLKKELEK